MVVTEEVERLRAWCSSQPLHPTEAASTNTAKSDEFLATTTSTNCLVNGKEFQSGEAFNPPGLSFIDQEPTRPDKADCWSVGKAMKASQETL